MRQLLFGHRRRGGDDAPVLPREDQVPIGLHDLQQRVLHRALEVVRGLGRAVARRVDRGEPVVAPGPPQQRLPVRGHPLRSELLVGQQAGRTFTLEPGRLVGQVEQAAGHQPLPPTERRIERLAVVRRLECVARRIAALGVAAVAVQFGHEPGLGEQQVHAGLLGQQLGGLEPDVVHPAQAQRITQGELPHRSPSLGGLEVDWNRRATGPTPGKLLGDETTHGENRDQDGANDERRRCHGDH
jgi:hypothetical protein